MHPPSGLATQSKDGRAIQTAAEMPAQGGQHPLHLPEYCVNTPALVYGTELKISGWCLHHLRWQSFAACTRALDVP